MTGEWPGGHPRRHRRRWSSTRAYLPAARSRKKPVGTCCRMGRKVGAVVDPRLRVYGVKPLRVADASIMPVVYGGNTNTPSIIIGEKCAAMVLENAVAA